jgi:hypothetical protein
MVGRIWRVATTPSFVSRANCGVAGGGDLTRLAYRRVANAGSRPRRRLSTACWQTTYGGDVDLRQGRFYTPRKMSKGNDFAKFTGEITAGVFLPARGLPPFSPRLLPRTRCAPTDLPRAIRRVDVTLCAHNGARTTDISWSRYRDSQADIFSAAPPARVRPSLANSASWS